MGPIQEIPIEQIDESDETFSVSFMADLERLRSSIQAVGPVQPVLLREKEGGHQIVCGFRRISVMKEVGRRKVESRVFHDGEVSALELFTIALHDNLTGRGFNAVERAIALDKLVHQFQVEPGTVIQSFLPLFSLETNEKILNTYLSLARMEDEVKRYVVQEEVSRSNIRRFFSMASEDRRAALFLLSFLKLGENSLKEVMTLLEEISRRAQQPVREIVDRPEIQAILSQRELTRPQKTERVRKALAELRYPRMHGLEERFEKKRRGLNLPPGISLLHPPHFEGRGLRIQLQFETVDQYRSLLDSLSLLPGKKEFGEMMEKG